MWTGDARKFSVMGCGEAAAGDAEACETYLGGLPLGRLAGGPGVVIGIGIGDWL